MSSCKKVENPCKICLQTVTTRTGIRCHGQCKTWIHFNCLNYTPGKIRDVKKGIITVACPCPDCKSIAPKEYLTVQPYACDNIACPANNPPACDQPDCVANIATRNRPAICPPEGTLRTCAPGICCQYQTDRDLPTQVKAKIQPERDLYTCTFDDKKIGDDYNEDKEEDDEDEFRDKDKDVLLEEMAKQVEELTHELKKLKKRVKQDAKHQRHHPDQTVQYVQCNMCTTSVQKDAEAYRGSGKSKCRCTNQQCKDESCCKY